MTRYGYDCAYLPVPTPAGYAFAGGYVWQAHHEAARIWSVNDWRRAAGASRYLLPIATCWAPFGDGRADAARAVLAWRAILDAMGLPVFGCAFALDVEAGIAPQAAAYVAQWRAGMTELGYYGVPYTSRSTAQYLGAGPKWIAFGRLGGDVVISQTGSSLAGAIDTDSALELVPFYDTQRPPPPPPEEEAPEMVLVVMEDQGIYLLGGAPKPIAVPSLQLYALLNGDGGIKAVRMNSGTPGAAQFWATIKALA